MKLRRIVLAALTAMGTTIAMPALAAPVVFSSATATFEQTFDGQWLAAKMIDGDLSATNGWAIYDGNGTSAQAATFTLATPLAAGSYNLVFTISQLLGFQHTLGDFTLGAVAGGPVPMVITNVQSPGGGGFIVNSGGNFGNVVASGANPDTAVYTVSATVTALSAITGITLNVNANPSFPTNGPGRAVNGNFVVTEFALDATAIGNAVPEPAIWAMLIMGFGAIGATLRRLRVNVAFS